MESIEAKIVVPITAHYTEEDLTKMFAFDAKLAKMHSLFMILGEEQPITLRTPTEKKLEDK
jgi:hypothetical protein